MSARAKRPASKGVTNKPSRARKQAANSAKPVGPVAQAYQQYPARLRPGLMRLRRLAFMAASQTDAIGELTEALRWGVPSYLTEQTKSGTTVRLGVESKTADRFGLYVPCQTTLIADFRQLYGDLFTYSGKRALLFEPGAKLPEPELLHCLTLAFTYHSAKRKR